MNKPPCALGIVRWVIVWISLATLPALGQEPGSKFTSFAGFELGTVNFAEVQRRLGPAPLVDAVDLDVSGHSTDAVCYRTQAGLVYFLTNDLGGPENELLGVGLTRGDSTKRCAAWPKRRAAPALSVGGLRLGITKTEFRRAVATEVTWEGDVGSAFFNRRRKMTKAEIADFLRVFKQSTAEENFYYDISIMIHGVFKNGKLSELQVWKTESN
jgi:hypothetical protein